MERSSSVTMDYPLTVPYPLKYIKLSEINIFDAHQLKSSCYAINGAINGVYNFKLNECVCETVSP